jgi:hypothetical protein
MWFYVQTKETKMKLASSGISGLATSILAALVLAVGVSEAAFAQADPFVGTWKLNLAKSTYKPGPPPKSVTLTGVAAGQGVQVTADAISATGGETHTVFTIVYDGKFHPIAGSQVADANAAFRSDANTLEYAYTKDGSLVQVGSYVFAADGRSLTIATKGTSVLAAGQRVDNVAVYDKQ